nr:BsuBI/PstI family type II restriction endonuclease [Paenibacillus pinisoli]
MLSQGEQSELIEAINEEFAERFVPGGILIFAGDTGGEYLDEELLSQLGISVDTRGKMPDVVIYNPWKNWLLLTESVTSHDQWTENGMLN